MNVLRDKGMIEHGRLRTGPRVIIELDEGLTHTHQNGNVTAGL
jgi:hypothetical protein